MRYCKNSFDRFPRLVKFQAMVLLVFFSTMHSCKIQDMAAVTNESHIMLRDGVVVNLDKKEIYFANKEGMVEAIEFESGQTTWQANIKGRPLCLSKEKLIVQLEPNQDDIAILFGELDTGDSGTLVKQEKVAVPEKVVSMLRNTVDGSFYLTPYEINKAFIFEWAYFPPLQGDYNEGEEMNKQGGAIRFDGGNYKDIDLKTLPRGYNNRPIKANTAQQITRENSQQFVSKNGKHLLVSVKDQKSTALQSYTWEVFDLATKERIGALASHASYAPFVVFGNHLLLERGPYETFDNRGVNKTPLQLVCFDLQDGKELWKHDILDTIYRGPTPP